MQDPTSFSSHLNFKTQHVNISWAINFEEKTLSGFAELSFKTLNENINSLVLDTRDLKIIAILLDKESVGFSLGDKHEAFGSALTINLPKPPKIDDVFSIHIIYETSSSASALQWLTPQQTATKKHPYMFSQCQAIHARSILPCQDTPSDKFTYNASVTSHSQLTVLMSAVAGDISIIESRKVSNFQQKVPIPSYLLAIVCGYLEGSQIGPRTKVYCEVGHVKTAADEFIETEQMIAAGEKLVGPYVWNRYDILVLPPSFPYGGMENPCLTFVTPTLLAGDKSLANVVAHEIAHSWTGNLVTNRTWEDFWLNEGHTVFLERKILGLFYGESTRQFYAQGGLKALQDSIDVLGKDNPLTNLVPKLDNVDPDDAFSSVPYEKGHTLLFYLEELLGGPAVFEPFLLSYIQNFSYQSVTTSDWKNYLYSYFSGQKDLLDSVDWESWFNKPGMPPVIPNYDKTLLQKSLDLCERWSNETDLSVFSSTDIDEMSSKQKIEFLGELLLKKPLTTAKYEAMDKYYNFSKSGNSEIKFRWIQLGIRAHSKQAIAPALDMVTEQGRMKFTRPLYRSLGDWSESREAAIKVFRSNYSSMHSTTASLVAKDLNLQL